MPGCSQLSTNTKPKTQNIQPAAREGAAPRTNGQVASAQHERVVAAVARRHAAAVVHAVQLPHILQCSLPGVVGGWGSGGGESMLGETYATPRQQAVHAMATQTTTNRRPCLAPPPRRLTSLPARNEVTSTYRQSPVPLTITLTCGAGTEVGQASQE